MKQNVALESRITQAIIRALRNQPGIVIRKRHGSGWGVAGDADVYGSLYGRHFELEVKRPAPSSRLTRIQEIRLAQWRRSGAIVGVVTNVREALDTLFPPVTGAGQEAAICAHDLVAQGVIDKHVVGAVTTAITTAILSHAGWGRNIPIAEMDGT